MRTRRFFGGYFLDLIVASGFGLYAVTTFELVGYNHQTWRFPPYLTYLWFINKPILLAMILWAALRPAMRALAMTRDEDRLTELA